MLKVGDKLLCKKTTSRYNYKYLNTIIIDTASLKEAGRYYNIFNIINNTIFFDDGDYYYLYPKSLFYVWNYFYTPQELRKMKLERLKQYLK